MCVLHSQRLLGCKVLHVPKVYISRYMIYHTLEYHTHSNIFNNEGNSNSYCNIYGACLHLLPNTFVCVCPLVLKIHIKWHVCNGYFLDVNRNGLSPMETIVLTRAYLCYTELATKVISWLQKICFRTMFSFNTCKYNERVVVTCCIHITHKRAYRTPCRWPVPSCSIRLIDWQLQCFLCRNATCLVNKHVRALVISP